MAADLQTWDTSLPYHLYLPNKQAEHILPLSHAHTYSNIHINGSSSPLKSHVLVPHDFATPLPHSTQYIIDHTSHFMQLQHHHNFHISANLLEPPSTMWSPLGSKQGIPEVLCESSTNNLVEMFEKVKLQERGNLKYQSGCSNTSSDVGASTYQSFIEEQIRAIQLSRLKQEQILSLKQKLAAYRESQAVVPQKYEYQYDPSEKIMQLQKKGKGVCVEQHVNGWRTCPTRRGALHQQAGSRGASCGTGVFLPSGRTNAPPKRPGKGCSTVLIPARVVQALQLHFDQMAATSGPKAAPFPPLHDVLVSNRNGMYSLQQRQSRNATANIQNEMTLPQEWTY